MLSGSRLSWDSCGFLNVIPQDILEVFSFPLSNPGREPRATSSQMTLMHLDRAFLLDRCATCRCLQQKRWPLSTKMISSKLKASFA